MSPWEACFYAGSPMTDLSQTDYQPLVMFAGQGCYRLAKNTAPIGELRSCQSVYLSALAAAHLTGVACPVRSNSSSHGVKLAARFSLPELIYANAVFKSPANNHRSALVKIALVPSRTNGCFACEGRESLSRIIEDMLD
jgi:hypothetical protein